MFIGKWNLGISNTSNNRNKDVHLSFLSQFQRIGRVGRADKMGLAISLVSTVKEKVWFCQNGIYPPCSDTSIFQKGKGGKFLLSITFLVCTQIDQDHFFPQGTVFGTMNTNYWKKLIHWRNENRQPTWHGLHWNGPFKYESSWKKVVMDVKKKIQIESKYKTSTIKSRKLKQFNLNYKDFSMIQGKCWKIYPQHKGSTRCTSIICSWYDRAWGNFDTLIGLTLEPSLWVGTFLN